MYCYNPGSTLTAIPAGTALWLHAVNSLCNPGSSSSSVVACYWGLWCYVVGSLCPPAGGPRVSSAVLLINTLECGVLVHHPRVSSLSLRRRGSKQTLERRLHMLKERPSLQPGKHEPATRPSVHRPHPRLSTGSTGLSGCLSVSRRTLWTEQSLSLFCTGAEQARE